MKKKQVLFPRHMEILARLGENIKLARKRRKLTTIQVAQRANIDRTTLYEIEKGNPDHISTPSGFWVCRMIF